MTANDFYHFCTLGYRAMGYSGADKPEKEQYALHVYQHVLVMDMNRLARDTEGLELIGERLEDAGVRVFGPEGEIRVAPSHAYGYLRVATMEQTM